MKGFKIYKIGLFALFVGLLSITQIQKWRHWFKLEPLNGYFTAPEVPKFTFDAWFNGTYQVKKEKQIEETIGFRSLFVRIYNQCYYSLFNQAKANGVIIGKDNYLFEIGYINTALGIDYLGENEINNRIDSLQQISDYLKHKNISLLVVLAPGKGEFYSEFWPKEFNKSQSLRTNYLGFKSALLEKEIPTIDLQSYFLANKNTSSFPLYPKTGIHWSAYSDLLVADTIFQYLHILDSSFHYPRIKANNIRSSERMYLRDDDIEKSMNLLFNIPDKQMMYADIELLGDTANATSDFLIIADSYYFGIEILLKDNTNLPRGNYWYYHQQVYPATYTSQVLVDELDYKKEIEKNKVIVLLSTDANLKNFGFGFMKKFYENYFNNN